MDNIVRENLDFKRGLKPKESLGIGVYRNFNKLINEYFIKNFPHPRAKADYFSDGIVKLIIDRARKGRTGLSE